MRDKPNQTNHHPLHNCLDLLRRKPRRLPIFSTKGTVNRPPSHKVLSHGCGGVALSWPNKQARPASKLASTPRSWRLSSRPAGYPHSLIGTLTSRPKIYLRTGRN